MNVTIRLATAADTAIVARFNSLMASETEHITLDQARLQSGVAALLRDPAKGFYLLAEMDNIVVGQTMVTYEWSDWRNGVFWWIQSVYVEKQARGQGVFKALFEHIHGLAKSSKDVCGLRLYVEKNNARAKKTYERLGMKLLPYEMYETSFVL